MGQKSSIQLLPGDVFEEVNRLYRENATIEQIIDRVAEMGETISRSAMGRYTKNLNRLNERIAAGRDMANAIMEKFGEAPENKQADMNIHLLQAILTEIAIAADNPDGDGVKLKPLDAMLLAKALDHMAKAKKTDIETTRKIREEAVKDAAKAATTTAKKKGLSKEAVDEINASIMGIVKK